MLSCLVPALMLSTHRNSIPSRIVVSFVEQTKEFSLGAAQSRCARSSPLAIAATVQSIPTRIASRR
jgi:hypothetical protein